jgi:nitrite reductase (NADH) small subunit
MTMAAELGRMATIAYVSSIPAGEGRVFQVGPLSVAIFHSRSGHVFATEPNCPHREGPLADGIVGDRKVVCPLHAFVFDLSSGQPVGNSCRAIKTYPVTLTEEGQILVDTGAI